ncbi:hypothetical protein SAMN03080617_02123 [Algoriphagus alkaliphilus]|uniref:Lipoprotein n=1 Tax=Algoriphagus alkaliphilus TaxID=279824 RepID=A0A1G5XZV6_9BACT|nr:hypothetical protein [Algoriphagus alkaliphilus]SDA75951.1 hypothetical protein SAMN03080617_02123 [Algoriphagus alkaliphilus]
MKKYLFFFICSAFLLSCNENEGPTVCGVENPVEDLAWLKQEIETAGVPSSSEYSYLMQATYQGKTVFFFGFCNPLWHWALIIRDCEGNRIAGEISIFDLSDQKVIWKPADSVCTFD